MYDFCLNLDIILLEVIAVLLHIGHLEAAEFSAAFKVLLVDKEVIIE